MKRILLLLFSLITTAAIGQYPINQILSSDSTMVSVGRNATGGIRGGLVNMIFADTTAANLSRISYYTGAQIWTTTDSAIWVRFKGTPSFWVKMAGASGGTTGSFWNITGNYFGGGVPLNYGVGTNSYDYLPFKTNNTTRLLIPPDGILRSSASANKYLMMDTTTLEMYYGDGGGGSGWSLTGNSINAGTDFIGTTNNTSMRFRTNNTVRMVLDSSGNVGIGTTSPDSTLHVVGGLKFVTGRQGAGKVLTSNASGGADWATLYESIDSVGDVLGYSWAYSPYTDYWNKSGSNTVVTTSGGKTNFSGGSSNYSDQFILLGRTFGAENYNITQKFIPKNRSDTSIGFALQLYNSCALGGLTVKFNLSDTAGYISLHSSATNISQFDSTKGTQFFTWAANDTLEFKIKRRKTRLYVTLENITQKTNVYITYDYTTSVVVTPVLNCNSLLELYMLGGSYDFLDTLHFEYNEPESPKFVVLGNSITTGYLSDNTGKRFAEEIFEGLTNDYVVFAGPYERAADAVQRVKNDLLQYFHPENAIFCYGVNDVNGVDNKDSASARYQRAIQALVDSCSGNVYVLTPFPQSTNIGWMIDTLSAICTRTGAIFLNDYALLKDTSSFDANSLYVSDDGVHPNEIGHHIIASFVRKRLQNDGLLPLEYVSTQKYNNLPLNTDPKYILSTDDKNNLTATKLLPYPTASSLGLDNYVKKDGDADASTLKFGTTDNQDVIILRNGSNAAKFFSNGAARIGQWSGSVYNTVGDRSFSAGNDNYSAGISSTSLGQSNTTSANFSTAWGYNNTASGEGAMAGGYGSTASGSRSISFGDGNTASGSWDAAISGRNLSTNSKLGAFIIGDYSGGGSVMTSDVNDQFKGRFAGGWKFNISNSTTALYINSSGNVGIGTSSAPTTTLQVSGNMAANQGADVASANNLAVVANSTEITGTTQVNLIANTGWVNGAEINLLLANGITIKNGQTTSGSNITILLDGAADFVTASASMLTLVLSEVGGTQAWREKSRRSY